MLLEISLIVLFFTILLTVGVFMSQKNTKFNRDLIKREEEVKHKMYEIEILNKLNNRMGYSLDVKNVFELIIESLYQFVEYEVASYVLLNQDKLIFKAHLKKSVSRKFIDGVKAEILNSMSSLLRSDFKTTEVEETLWGTVLDGELNQGVGSFFNISLVVSGKVVGLLNIADERQNFYKEKEISTVNKIVQQAAQAFTGLQEVVEAEKGKLNAMVASMTEGVVMTDMEDRVIVVNPAARKALGLEDKVDLLETDLANSLEGKLDLADKINESVRLDKVFISDEISLPSGFFKIVVSPVKDRWQTLGCVVIFRDITREKEVEKIKEDFTSMIVHELRSPLDSIKKMIELMRATAVKRAKQEECFQMMYGSSSDMLELVNNLLDMAKIEAGKFDLRKQPSDIKEIVKGRILFFDVAARDAKVKLSSNFSKDTPDKVEFDQHTISQVLNNLISNALKFNKENGSIIMQTLMHKNGESITKEAKDSGIEWFIKNDIANIPDSLFVAVTNTGMGIAQDQIDKLFNKFFQVKSVFAQKGGTGLGLAITKSIIESHNGVVGAQSTEGQGATFYFTLPINTINESSEIPVKKKI